MPQSGHSKSTWAAGRLPVVDVGASALSDMRVGRWSRCGQWACWRMKAARRRISGMGEVVKEWKRSSSRRTRGRASSVLPDALGAVAAALDDHLLPTATASDLEVVCLGLPAAVKARDENLDAEAGRRPRGAR